MLFTFSGSGEQARDGIAGQSGTDAATTGSAELAKKGGVLLAEAAALECATVTFGNGETGVGRCDEESGEDERNEGCLVEHFGRIREGVKKVFEKDY